MPQYAVLIYDRVDAEPVPGAREAHERHARELVESQRMQLAIVLEDPETATSIRGDVISDGPFIEAKEVIAGLYVTEAADLDEALATARTNPILQQGGGVEVRPIEGMGQWPFRQ